MCTIGRICNRCTGCIAMATLWKCMAEPSGNPPGPPHAARSATHYACRRRLTPLAGHKIDAPAACAVPFRPYCGGVITRTRNVSEYMLVLALCLVTALLTFYPRDAICPSVTSRCSTETITCRITQTMPRDSPETL